MAARRRRAIASNWPNRFSKISADRVEADHRGTGRGEIRGCVPHPLFGEDAQAWVSRSRRESDEQRTSMEAERVKIADVLRTVTHLFLDTAPVIYYVERNSTYEARVDDIFDRIDAGSPGHHLTVTLAECLVGAIKQGLPQAQQDFTDLIVLPTSRS
jgi:hypothetical protein